MTFAGLDIGELSQLTLTDSLTLQKTAHAKIEDDTPNREKAIVAQRIASDILARVEALTRLGLGYLSLSAPRQHYRLVSCSDCD